MSYRRAVGVVLVLAAIAVACFDFAVATPYFLSHAPGPQNPSFGWYMLFKLVPYVSIIAVGALAFAGIGLVRRWASPGVPFAVAIATTTVLFGGGLAWTLATR